MPRARDLLDRFRPVGTPGAGSPAGVPADRRADALHELAPVFARLHMIDDECESTIRAARDIAARRDAESAAAAADILQRARATAPQLRADASARREAEALRDLVATRAAYDAEAARVLRVVEQRLPAYVDLVVARARERLACLGDSGVSR